MGLNDTPWFSVGLDKFDTLLEGGSLTGFPWNPMIPCRDAIPMPLPVLSWYDVPKTVCQHYGVPTHLGVSLRSPSSKLSLLWAPACASCEAVALRRLGHGLSLWGLGWQTVVWQGFGGECGRVMYGV